jgi:hypothetical protein
MLFLLTTIIHQLVPRPATLQTCPASRNRDPGTQSQALPSDYIWSA